MGQRKWFVIYTKPKSERKVAERLEKIGLEAFCPLQDEVRQWSDRKVKRKTPLFKSYVFVKIEPKKRSLVFEVPGVVKYLYWLGKPAIVKDHEIETIKNWMQREDLGGIAISNLTPGQEITLKNGSLKGQKAVVSEVGKKELVLQLVKMGCILKAKIREVI